MIAIWVTAFLAFARIGALLVSLPLFNAKGVPKHVPAMMAMGLTAVIAPGMPLFADPENLVAVGLALAGEILLGVLLGFGVSAVFSAFAMGSEIASQQMGLAMASLFDPLTKSNAGLIGTLASWLSGLVFLGAGLHLRFIELLAVSFDLVPLGSVGLPGAGAELAIQSVGIAVALGVQLSAPILALVFTINVFVAILARLAPRMNVFFSVGMTLGSTIGLLMFAAALPWLLLTHADALRGTLRTAVDMLGALG